MDFVVIFAVFVSIPLISTGSLHLALLAAVLQPAALIASWFQAAELLTSEPPRTRWLKARHVSNHRMQNSEMALGCLQLGGMK